MNKKEFHIITISNNLDQYAAMKASFLEAGFDEDRCRYSLFDNSQGNIYDPYRTFNEVKSQTQEPYIIFCHQDLLMNQGHGFNQLTKVLDELNQLDPTWAIAGNAGFNNDYNWIGTITDPRGSVTDQKNRLPEKVHSLDENFLVIKSTANIESSSGLQGFHLYGADLCLDAILKKYSCYVINFHLTHLSSGNLNASFWELIDKFQQIWDCQFLLCYVRTPTNILLCLSKFSFVKILFSQQIIQHICMKKIKIRRKFTPYQQRNIDTMIQY